MITKECHEVAKHRSDNEGLPRSRGRSLNDLALRPRRHGTDPKVGTLLRLAYNCDLYGSIGHSTGTRQVVPDVSVISEW
ncbi:unnamed protein product [Pieris brassicae]|uniref:Uncharacterized protein n=1 Tax=Pieris brassicae TaxID=7116 RepID=A0A9P0TFX5_PIEBR|nr:unnamed protein product [Pieris brassicae]